MSDDTKSNETYARYNEDAVRLIRQFVRESDRDDLFDMSYEDRAVATAYWFLESDNRWSRPYIRLTAAALTQWVEELGQAGLIPDYQAKTVVADLRERRPQPKSRSRSRRQRRIAKSIKLADLRRLIKHFRERNTALGRWIAGYLQLAARIGWRPGEMVLAWRDGNWLRAPAEKNTNERGLCATCEIGLHLYSRHLIEKLDAWLGETERLAGELGGEWALREVVRKRIERACEALTITPIALYTLRHVAIASMKKSGLSPEEIAVIINHASTRTASERYGQTRTGHRRPKKMFVIDPRRLDLVRDRARRHPSRRLRKTTPSR